MSKPDEFKNVSFTDSAKMGLNFFCMAGYLNQYWMRDGQFVGWRSYRQLPALMALGIPFLAACMGHDQFGNPETDPICFGYACLTVLVYLIRLLQSRKNRGKFHSYSVGKARPGAETFVGALAAILMSFVSPPLSFILSLSTMGNAVGTAMLDLRNDLAADEMANKVIEAEQVNEIYNRDYRNR